MSYLRRRFQPRHLGLEWRQQLGLFSSSPPLRNDVSLERAGDGGRLKWDEEHMHLSKH